MKNFEVQHTIRLYDPDLIAEIGRTYEAHSIEFRNKNDFLTELLRLGVKEMNSFPPTTPATDSMLPPAMLAEITDAVSKVREISEESGQYLTTQCKKLSVHLDVIESLLASVYSMQFGQLAGEPPLPSKVADGFFDDLPLRFEKIILSLEKKYGLK